MKKNSRLISTTTESIDLAALLLALGFTLNDVSQTEAKSVDGTRTPKQSTMAWNFNEKSEDGAWTIDKVQTGWTIPKQFTLDTLQLSRLLSHNLAVLKHCAQRPQALVWTDLGGIGIIGNEPYGDVVKELPVNSVGWGGCHDTPTIALAITLGCTPVGLYRKQGQLHVLFQDFSDRVNVSDIQRFMADDRLRDPLNSNAIAVLVCQLDNRSVILKQMQDIRRKVRLVADGGETQVLYDPSTLTDADKERIYRHFD